MGEVHERAKLLRPEQGRFRFAAVRIAPRGSPLHHGVIQREDVRPQAVAEVLFGKVNPSGKLAVTFPRRIEDTPTYLYYPAGRDVLYGEGVFVGYRYYDKRKIAPLFPFGFGLSYTTFAYSNLRVPASVRMPVVCDSCLQHPQWCGRLHPPRSALDVTCATAHNCQGVRRLE